MRIVSLSAWTRGGQVLNINSEYLRAEQLAVSLNIMNVRLHPVAIFYDSGPIETNINFDLKYAKIMRLLSRVRGQIESKNSSFFYPS